MNVKKSWVEAFAAMTELKPPAGETRYGESVGVISEDPARSVVYVREHRNAEESAPNGRQNAFHDRK
jgi:hypothetical protein